MGFIQPCFIRKNTPELRKKLEELGYKPFGSVKYELDTGWGISTDNRLGEFESFDNNGLENIMKCEPPDYEVSIDCGTNEELFISLAALRDDTDINQIYWWNERYLVKCIRDCSSTLNIESTPYYMCQLIDNSDIKFEIPCKELRKATVEELIEHFK